jgi:hypothetical protein
MKEPEIRFCTKASIEELAKELNLEYNPDDIQDWEYIAGNPKDIGLYISHYKTLVDDDKKFTLMEIIIQAATDQETPQQLKKYWNIIEPILKQNFLIHEYSVFYWCSLDNPNLDDCWDITPYMRNLWNKIR